MAEFSDYAKCNTCMACFASTDKIKEHYRSDWHAYNSKRRSAGLIPLKRNEYKTLVSSNKSKDAHNQQRSDSAPDTHSSHTRPRASTPHIPTKRSMNKSLKRRGEVLPPQQFQFKAQQQGSAEQIPDETRLDNIEITAKISADRNERDRKGTENTNSMPDAANEALVEDICDAGDIESEDEASGEWGDVDDDGEFLDGDDGDEEENTRDDPQQAAAYAAARAKVQPHISLFDDADLGSAEECVRYMRERFGFFLPDAEYLCDLAGLLRYLGEKVRLGGYCLYCQKKLQPGRACQNHMVSKSHCKLRFEEGVDMEEFEEFYDYSAAYSSDDDGEGGPEGAQLVLEAGPDGELQLPDGRVLGHRSLRRFYKGSGRRRNHHP